MTDTPPSTPPGAEIPHYYLPPPAPSVRFDRWKWTPMQVGRPPVAPAVGDPTHDVRETVLVCRYRYCGRIVRGTIFERNSEWCVFLEPGGQDADQPPTVVEYGQGASDRWTKAAVRKAMLRMVWRTRSQPKRRVWPSNSPNGPNGVKS